MRSIVYASLFVERWFVAIGASRYSIRGTILLYIKESRLISVLCAPLSLF